MSAVGIAIGVILVLYFGGTILAGLIMQCKAAKQSKEAFGKFPVCNIVMHFIIGILFCLTAFLSDSLIFVAPLIFGLVLQFYKLLSLVCNQECKSFSHVRNVQETDKFLSGIRAACPRAYIQIVCWHNEVHQQRDSYGNVQTFVEKRVTYSPTVDLQITGFYDTTPPLYIQHMSSVMYLKLLVDFEWLGRSMEIINSFKAQLYESNKWRDTNTDVTFHTAMNGITEDNYLANGKIPPCMNRGCMILSYLLCFDALYLCMLRSRTPKMTLRIQKHLTIERDYTSPQNKAEEVQKAAQSADQIEPPVLDFDQFIKTNVDAITVPPMIKENPQPFVVDKLPTGMATSADVVVIGPPTKETVIVDTCDVTAVKEHVDVESKPGSVETETATHEVTTPIMPAQEL